MPGRVHKDGVWKMEGDRDYLEHHSTSNRKPMTYATDEIASALCAFKDVRKLVGKSAPRAQTN